MASRHQICCVTRSAFLNHHQRIRGVGGVNPDGSRWKLGEAEAIAAIEAGRWEFYISRGRHDVAVLVATSRYGSKYLKTALDGLQPESLLALPDCP